MAERPDAAADPPKVIRRLSSRFALAFEAGAAAFPLLIRQWATIVTYRLLVLGGRDLRQPRSELLAGWHLGQLAAAASRRGLECWFGDYESLAAHVPAPDQLDGGAVRNGSRTPTGAESSSSFQRLVTAGCGVVVQCSDGTNVEPEGRPLEAFDAILTRTMPAGSMEQITFRLASLHAEMLRRRQTGRAESLVNPPGALEVAIDKWATIDRAGRLGIPVPPTVVVQSRREAMAAFVSLGGDVVVKPIFGGEGRGVMRIRDRELAWTAFSTLERIGAVLYVQQFIPPGGVDLRLLIIGAHVHALRRRNPDDFRTNIRGGGRCELMEPDSGLVQMAMRLCADLSLRFAAVDFLETEKGDPVLAEVNAIPGWKGAQQVIKANLADQVVDVLRTSHRRETAGE